MMRPVTAVPTVPCFFRRFWPLLALGLVGVLGLLPQMAQMETARLPSELALLPRPAQAAVLLLNPMLLIVMGSALGAALAHRVSLGSVLAGTAPGAWRGLAPPALTGLALAAVLVAMELVWRPLLGAQAPALEPTGHLLQRLWVGLLYGGIAEEIIMRWGLMSLLAWALHRTFARRADRAPASLVMVAAVLSALVFAAAHLPALAAVTDLTPAVTARTVALNSVAGLVYGWLFWRQHLEAAMTAHAATHLGFALLRPLLQ
jgi:Type II CAAX prenyl endopeptidase Rce1-like